jgi:integrase
MRKTSLKLTKVRVRGRFCYCVTVPKLGGGRSRRFFPATPEGKREAETVLQISKAQRENYGTAALSLSDAQRSEYLDCLEKLKPFGMTLREAVNLLLPQLESRNRSGTVSDLVRELLTAKAADGASARYLGDLKSRLGRFTAAFEGRSASSLSGAEIDSWLRGLPVAATTRNNFRRVLIVAFNFAVQHEYCASNPAERTARVKPEETTPGILTPSDTARLLEECDSALLPYVAIGAFSGLRTAELQRLDWSEIELAGGLILVTGKKAKSARRRFVKIHENLAAWLQPHAKSSGPVAPLNCRGLLEDARSRAGIKQWPPNALRHGYASYHLAKFSDAAALALELGHTNSNLIFDHYRQATKPSAAEAYWNIRPVKAKNVVQMQERAL